MPRSAGRLDALTDALRRPLKGLKRDPGIYRPCPALQWRPRGSVGVGLGHRAEPGATPGNYPGDAASAIARRARKAATRQRSEQ